MDHSPLHTNSCTAGQEFSVFYRSRSSATLFTEPYRSSPHTTKYFNIILWSKSTSSKPFLPYGFICQNFIRFSISCMRATWLDNIIIFWFDSPNNIWRGILIIVSLQLDSTVLMKIIFVRSTDVGRLQIRLGYSLNVFVNYIILNALKVMTPLTLATTFNNF